MAAHAVTLRLPAPLYKHYRSRARSAQRSLEAELLNAVTTVAEDEEELSPALSESIADLELLTDDELWRAARNRLSDDTKAKLDELNFKQQREGLVPAEKQLLEQLVRQYDEAVLLRAEAARLLKARGRDVSKLLTER